MTIGKKIRLAGPVCIILVTQIISNPAYADSTSAGLRYWLDYPVW
jgi:hypothetical protein